MAGATGLDYNVLFQQMDRLKLEPAEYEQIQHDIQIMESEALSVMHAKKE